MVQISNQFFKKGLSYVRNKYYGHKTLRRIIKKAPDKVENVSEFLKNFYLQNNSQGNQKPINIKFKDGFRISCRPKDLSALAETCILEDYKPVPEMEIHSGQTVFDVGAHIGTFSVYAANKGAKVYAIEPDNDNFDRLRQNIQLNNLQSRIMPIKGALYFKTGKISINFNSLNSGGHALSEQEGVLSSLVDCFTLSDLLKKFNLASIALLKMDIEGAEYKIFEHMKDNEFKSIKKIVAEYHLDLVNENNYGELKKYLSPYFNTIRRYAPYYFYAFNKI